ncbi:MAG: heliorhodopsin HeR [Candidatus Saccharimonadales bacterium]
MKLHYSNPFTTAPVTHSAAEINASLQKWNRNLAILHALQGVVILILSATRAFPITAGFLTKDTLASSAAGHVVLAPATHVLFNLNLAYLVATFFFLSALAHLLMAAWYRRRYEVELKQGKNRLRWFEYSLSASVMLVGIAILSGIYDAGSLLLIFALVAVMNLCGLVMETHNSLTKRGKVNWLSYWIGCIAGIVPWLVIAGAIIAANIYGSGNIPGFVYGIYISMFLFFTSFAVNMYLQYKKQGKWASYYYGERGYMVLSLVAKSVLAWQVFAGALRP